MSTATANDATYVVLDLDGTSHVETAADLGVRLDGSAPFTVEAWIKLDVTATASLLSQEGAFSFGVAGPCLVLSVSGLPSVTSNPRVQPLTSSDWHYVAVTHASGTFRFYIDGRFNALQAVSGTGRPTGAPFLIGKDLQAHLRSLRVHNTDLSLDAVRAVMFGGADPATVVADLDFSVTPPVDRGPGHLPLRPGPGVRMTRCTPALALTGTAFAEPLGEHRVNPGGAQVDPYTVQAWLCVESTAQPEQAVLVNGDLEGMTGMALYLEHDPAAGGFRVVSQRGSSLSPTSSLRSTSLVKPDKWTNIATTFDGVLLTVYVDGQPAGAAAFGPVPLDSAHGEVQIGAGFTVDQPFATMPLQGHVSRLEVWSRALTAAEVLTHLHTPPADDAPGLEANYDFTTERMRDDLSDHPVGLADGATVGEHTEPATAGGPAPTGRPALTASPEPLSRVELEALRASIDPAALLREHGADLRRAMEADTAAVPGAEDRQRVHDAWQEVLDQIGRDPTALPFFLTTHLVDGHHVVLCHRRGETHVALRMPVTEIDECTMWKVVLVFIVVAGVLDALFAVRAYLSPSAVRYISNTVLGLPKLRVLLAVGTAATAAEIFALAAELYAHGILRQLLNMVLELGFWALIRIAVRLGLTLLGVGAADVIASLVATTATFILHYSNKPASCTPLPKVELTGIKFDHDPTGTAADALTIRRDRDTPVPQVQWTKDLTKPEESPAAYAVTRVANRAINIQAGFAATGPADAATSVQVKADGGGLLGPIDPFTVTFENGTSKPAYVTIPLNHHALASGGVRRQDITWTWSYRVPEGSWQPMATTAHRVYVVLDTPSLPWRPEPNGGTQQPWTDVLDLACQWAGGATTPGDAAAAITTRVNGSLGLTYDTDSGTSVYTSDDGYGQVFSCTAFLNELGNRPGGQGKKVNCTDCASIVTAFANVLGCNLKAFVMGSGSRTGFGCNKIQAIGHQDWAYPFANHAFAYHEVAWDGKGCFDDPLYDACLKVDGGTAPWDWTTASVQHLPTLPLRMTFEAGELAPDLPIPAPFTASSYRERLAANNLGGIPQCRPLGPWMGTQNGCRRVQ